jgi:hypothetical protein
VIEFDVSSIRFHGSPSSGSHADTCIQTENHDKANAFCDYVNARKNLW